MGRTLVLTTTHRQENPMSLIVNTNTASINAMKSLNKTNRSLGKSFERLSSGLRISRAADDAAGLGVAENLDNAARSARVAMRNVNDGISVIATAEGASNEVSNIRDADFAYETAELTKYQIMQQA